MRVSPLLAAVVCLVAPGLARAADHPLGGDVLRLKEKASGQRTFVFRATADPALLSLDGVDPRSGGATFEIRGSAGGDGVSGVVTLPAAGWKAIGTRGFRFRDRKATTGVRQVVLRTGRRGGTLVIEGGGAAWSYRVAQPQQSVWVGLAVGGERWCAEFSQFARNERGRVSAGGAAPPASCSPPPRCGNGDIEGAEACDDGNLADGDGCSAACTVEPCGNGTLEAGEECDDGNHASGDGCSAACTFEACSGVTPVSGTSLATERVTGGLSMPVLAVAPRFDRDRLFVVEQGGTIRILENGVLQQEPFLDLSGQIACCGEQGLLGLAFHPDYARNGRFFVSYTTSNADVLARFTVGSDPDVADPMSEAVLLSIPDFASNHNGGMVAFGPDGYLYYGTGDGGGGGDPQGTGQDPARLLGKMLRLDVDVDDSPYYAIPPTNPYAGAGDPLDEIWARGLRNPWRWSFDRGTGDLYIADVGQGAWEEVNVVTSGAPGAYNFGWSVFEGDGHCYAGNCPDPATGFTMPVIEYDHGQGCSVTGGFVYRGCAMPDVHGTYFYGDYCAGFIRSFRGVSGGVAQNAQDRTQELAPPGNLAISNVSGFGEDARGEVYVLDYADGELYRIIPGS